MSAITPLQLQAVVLAPTRELAVQSHQVLERIAAGLPTPAPRSAVFVGGLPTADDEKRLRRCVAAAAAAGLFRPTLPMSLLPLSWVHAVLLPLLLPPLPAGHVTLL